MTDDARTPRGAQSIELDDLRRQPYGEPGLELHLTRAPWHAAREQPFAPLRLPTRGRLTLRGPLWRQLGRATLRATLELRPGTYGVPLAQGPDCAVEVAQGTRMEVRAEVRRRGAQGRVVVQGLQLSFAPALRIENVVQTLGQIHELASDRLLRRLDSLWGRMPRWLGEVGGAALGSADVAATVLLEGVAARATGSAAPLLRPAFSGRVRWFDQLEVPFDRVVLPAPVLPLLHADLERLLSDQPLATASLVHELRDPWQLATVLYEMLGQLDGELVAELTPPPVTVGLESFDGQRTRFVLRAAVPYELRAQLQGQKTGDDGLQLRGSQLRLSQPGRESGLQATLESTLQLDLSPGQRPLHERVAVDARLDVAPGSRVEQLWFDLLAEQALCGSELSASAELCDLELDAGLRLRGRGAELSVALDRTARLSGRLGGGEPLTLRHGGARMDATLPRCTWGVAATPTPDGRTQLEASVEGRLLGRFAQPVTPIPEIDIHRGDLSGQLDASFQCRLCVDLAVGPGGSFDADMGGSRLALELTRLDGELDGRQLVLPPGSSLHAAVVQGQLSAAGPREVALDVEWDLHGRRCMLYRGELAVSLLSRELRSGSLVLHVDPQGRIRFSGHRDGFYGVRFFNALLNPAGDPGYLQELLRSDDAVAHVVAALEALDPRLAELLLDLQALYRAAESILRREGVREPRHLIPRSAMTRLMSLLLCGDARLQQRLVPIVKDVTEGKGLDLVATKELLQQELAEFDIDYELSCLLNWLDLVLSPAEMMEPPRVTEAQPLDLDPAFAAQRDALPSAAEIYRLAQRATMPLDQAHRLARLAPRLTRAQLGYLIQRASRVSWPARALAWLRYVHALKQRVEAIADGFGGVEYVLQPLMVATFLGEAVGPLPGINVAQGVADAAPERGYGCALGPEEVAQLMMAGLAWGRQNTRAQVNNRLLIELLRLQPASFTREVLIEIAHLSPRALSGVLYAFLAQDQDRMAQPVDLAALLEERLGVVVPRRADYMAGGRVARESYYEALSRLSDAVIDQSGAYLSAKLRLQAVRHPLAPQLVLSRSVNKLAQEAQRRIAMADELGASCHFDGRRKRGPHRRTVDAYRRAFRACERLLAQERRAFQLPWLRTFWQRNEEALRVLSVVRGVQQDRDQDRRWLAVQSNGRPLPPTSTAMADQQALLERVVEVLWHEPAHRDALLGDPLTRLLIDPRAGRYDFTIVSCMGVITEGRDGSELERAFERLAQQREVRLLRAHTGTARTLEYNARRIIEAIEQCQTPFGLIGYSQGCANALLAEQMLHTGTPDQQALVRHLVCRNLLFSAANGSAHGSCGMLKFRRAMVLAERYLKHYQAVMSQQAVESVLGAMKGVLDSSAFIAALGGADSLTYERALALHRDGQFVDGVPTSYTRGVARHELIPETLEWLFFMLREQTGGGAQDTQVLVQDAVGHASRVRNDYTAVLERCDMGAHPQATHHWAPLTREIEFVTTERDLERAVYMSPKDRMVWPWVEVNARFGLIRRV